MATVTNVTVIEKQQTTQSKTAESENLERLRAKYESKPAEVFDPKFRRVADRIFNARGTRAAPYAGLPTLLTTHTHSFTPGGGRGGRRGARGGGPGGRGGAGRAGGRGGPRA